MRPDDYKEDNCGCRFCKHAVYNNYESKYFCYLNEDPNTTLIKWWLIDADSYKLRAVDDCGTCSKFEKRA
jgi:hypothetical protein